MKLIDLHCDTIFRLFYDEREVGLRDNELHVDLKKLRKADSLAQFFALFIDYQSVLEEGRDPFKESMEMLDRFYREVKENNDQIELARSFKDLLKREQEDKIAAFLTIEEGGVIGNKLSNLRNFYRLGVRLITLTWNYANSIGYPNCKEEYRNKGLTFFGKEVVREMNRLGMIIDVSHLSDAGFYDVAEVSIDPFIASHSNARVVKNHSRNLTDEMIKILAESGGVMGINFAAYFLGDGKESKIADIVRHIKHIKKVGGVDVIAIGSDLDGIECELEIGNIGEIDRLVNALQKEGFSLDQIEKIFYKNAKRVIRAVSSS